MVWGGSCEPGFPKIIAGSHIFLRVSNGSDRSALPLISGWPDGYILETALDLSDDQPFIPTPGLIETMEPIRILSQLNLSADGDLRQNPATFWNFEDLNAKDFVLKIPASLAGHTVKFRAIYQKAELDLVSFASNAISIIAPCDRSDTARSIATQIYEAWELRNYRRAMAIADSMLAYDLSDAAGWAWAMSAANGAREYDKAISYLDRMYEDYGVTAVLLNSSHPPRLNRLGSRTREAQEEYEMGRSRLLQMKGIDENQQQQK